MSFDFSTLVTDRTRADVNRVKQIAEKIKHGTASESELAEFNSSAMKGAYNYTDLNRVTAAMEALKAKLEGYGYAVPGYQRIKVPHPSAGGGSRLPEGYTELAWIESTGTQYVDTGFKPNQDTRVVMDAYMTKESLPSFFFGSRNSSYNVNYGILVNSTGVRSTYGASTITMSGASVYQRALLDKNKNVCLINDATVTNTESTFQTEFNLFLFASNEFGTANYFGYISLYSCQIYDNGTLVRNYVPCINPSGVVGLYDMINDAFYQNAGTGAFTAGEEIVPPADVPSEEFDPYLWYEFDWPTTGAMTVYLLNVSVIRSVLAVMNSTPSVPVDMVDLMVQEANDIEVILLDVYRQLNIMATTFIPCGEALSGGDNL